MSPNLYFGTRPWFIWKSGQHLEDELALAKHTLPEKSRKEVEGLLLWLWLGEGGDGDGREEAS